MYFIWLAALSIILFYVPNSETNNSYCLTGSQCSGVGSYYNDSIRECVCGEGLWGSTCQYGRVKLTSMSGSIIETEKDYPCDSKYMFLIDSGRNNVPIQISMHEFQTECNWDHLYIFDGNSISGQQLAALSGSTINEDTPSRLFTAYSGSMFLYFYSDANKIEKGFNLTYRISECNSSFCNWHGFCEEINKCKCEKGWVGSHCDNKMNYIQELDLFTAKTTTTGTLSSNQKLVTGRASHAAAVHDSIMWIYGGISFENVNTLLSYNMVTNVWHDTKTGDFGEIYDHSMIFYANNLYVYGGFLNNTVSNQLFKYSIGTNSWTNPTITGAKPFPVSGHASVEVKGTMFVFFGYTEYGQTLNQVQSLSLDNSYKWSIVETTGALVTGRFGHTASYDWFTDSVYIAGGNQKKRLSADLLVFEVQTAKWIIKNVNRYQSMLHSASIIGRNLVLFGGSSNSIYVASSNNPPAQCFENQLLIYNIECNSIIIMNNAIKKELTNQNRYGHSSVVHNNSVLYVFGGFDGIYRNDVYKIKIKDDCSKYVDQADCLSAPILAGCVWQTEEKKCIFDTGYEPNINKKTCLPYEIDCKQIKPCTICAGYALCAWSTSDENCGARKDKGVDDIIEPDQCVKYKENKCSTYRSCDSCNVFSYCYWNFNTGSCNDVGNKNVSLVKFSCNLTSTTIKPCTFHQNCSSCFQNNRCMWCESEQSCVHMDSYAIEFPYGQCLEWISNVTENPKTCKDITCKAQDSCESCQQLPECGWCSDLSNTGLGKCIQGGEDGPNTETCPNQQWHFMKTCPACHCNGHSSCFNGTDTCQQCYRGVIGKHCDKCKFGFYGNPTNNGTCDKRCECNGHLRSCNLNGACECNMQGASGTHCEKCDGDGAKYYGNATNGGACYAHLQVNYLYSRNFTQVNSAGFVGIPEDLKQNFKFTIKRINGVSNALLNLSIYYDDGYSTDIAIAQPIDSYQIIVEESDYDESATSPQLRAFVYGWNEDEYFACKISYTHPPQPFDLIHFLIMFLVCFCSLLILLIVLWKAKQRYDIYIQHRRARHEHEERISRPFKAVTIRLDNEKSKEKIIPTQIAYNQFSTGHFAVATYIVQLPKPGGITPDGQSGICLASTVITTPHHQKQTMNIQEKLKKKTKRTKCRGTQDAVV